MITPLGIKAAQAESKKKGSDVFLSDDTGQRLGWRLLLRCLPSGSATWIFRYSHDGKRNQINLGNLEKLDIHSARNEASEFADIYKNYPDVVGKLRADELAKHAAAEEAQALANAAESTRQMVEKYTLSAMMAMYVDYLKKQGKNRTALDVASLSKHLSTISNKPASSITKGDLVTIQRLLLDSGKGRTANKLRSFVHAAYALVLRADSDATSPKVALEFATIGRVEMNPASLVAVAKGFNGTRDRVLTDIELHMLLEHSKKAGAAGLAVRATIFLGGQRIAQLLRASIYDIQDDFLLLFDPKGKRATPRKHPIPLEGMAGIVIDEALERSKSLNTTMLFSTTGEVQLNPITVTDYITNVSTDFNKSGVSISPFILADLRRTIETRLAGLGVSKDHRAYLQSHGLSGVQTRHYDRHEYEQEKRHALRLLHRWLKTLGKPIKPKLAKGAGKKQSRTNQVAK